MQHPTLDQHLNAPGPKRILSLDGGGVRGILTLGYLAELESKLRARYGNDPGFVLSDYFDLIGGTSTGAIIAAGLAMGWPVRKLRELYEGLAEAVFKRSWYRLGIFDAKFPTGPLEAALTTHFGDVQLGGAEVVTGLMIMAKRLDTGSPWVIHNHPRGKYYDPPPPSKAFPNRRFRLRQVIRASTAAPHFFEPERILVAEGVPGAFVDGGVSPHNNPALQLFMLATLTGYGWNWKTGADNLLLVSVGTGDSELRLKTDEVMEYPAADVARRALLSLMDDCSVLGQTMLQWISRCLTPWQIDREIGDLAKDQLGGLELLTYVRYNVHFDPAWIARNLQIDIDEDLITGLKAMDNPGNLAELAKLGAAGAAKQVLPGHLPAGFDVA